MYSQGHETNLKIIRCSRRQAATPMIVNLVMSVLVMPPPLLRWVESTLLMTVIAIGVRTPHQIYRTMSMTRWRNNLCRPFSSHSWIRFPLTELVQVILWNNRADGVLLPKHWMCRWEMTSGRGVRLCSIMVAAIQQRIDTFSILAFRSSTYPYQLLLSHQR